MKYYMLDKSKMNDLISSLKGKYKVVGPKAKENQFVFGEIDSADELKLLHKPTILSLKKYFLPQTEKLLDFKFGDITAFPVEVDQKQTVILGAHTCDIAGMVCLDHACGIEPRDKNFFKRKKNLILVGIECSEPCDEHATCVTMGTHNPKGGFDIMLTEAGSSYLVQVNSELGEKCVSEAKKIFKDADSKAEEKIIKARSEKDKKWKKNLKPKLEDIKGIMEKTAKSAVWEEVGKKCVSCGNCTNVCPTCYCFDIKDDVDLLLNKGERSRVWDSCQLKEFAEVAGNENFRKQRKDRQKHRYMRKFVFSVDKYNRHFCVGCGRCTRTCMASINLYETVNALSKESV